MHRARLILPLICALGAICPLYSDTYDEGVNGPVSNDYQAPTAIAVSPGSNTIIGTVAANQDYVQFAVPAGHVLSSLTLDSYSTSGTASNVSFFAIAPGTSSPVAPPGSNPITGILGWTLWNASDIGTNLLRSIGQAGSGATGFTAPLPSGNYTFWIQDTAQTVDYEISFAITPGISGARAAFLAKQKECVKLTLLVKKAKAALKSNPTTGNRAKVKKATAKLKACQKALAVLREREF